MSLNDPRWGNQPNGRSPEDEDDEDKRNGQQRPSEHNGANRPQSDDGPPDLEDVWRDFNHRLHEVFGGKKRPGGRHGGGGGGGGSVHLSGGMIALLALVLLVVWLASGFYTVNANERGVVLRFGRPVQTTSPGLRWHFPYPVEQAEIVDLTGVRTIEVGYRGSGANKVLREALMLTDDTNIVNIQFAVQYILKNPEDYLFNNRLPDESVKQAAETAMREIVGKSKMDFVLYEGREQIAANAHDLMQTILDRYQTGISISRVTMQNAQPPEQVQAAFDDAVKAGQDRERLRNEGEAYANKIVPLARGDAARMLEQAQGYRARVEADAQGETARFTSVLNEYRRAPDVTRQRLYLSTIQQVLSATSKVLVDGKGANNLMLMPLDKLFAGGAAAAGSKKPTAAEAADASSLRSAFPDTNSTRGAADAATNYRDRAALRDRGLTQEQR